MPAARLNTKQAMEEALKLAEEALIRAFCIQDGVPPAADYTVIAFERCPVMCSMHLPGDQDSLILEHAQRGPEYPELNNERKHESHSPENSLAQPSFPSSDVDGV